VHDVIMISVTAGPSVEMMEASMGEV